MSKPIARIYQRVSTEGQDLTRQQLLRANAEAKGYQVVATYSEKESGTSEARPELLRMMADLNEGDTIIAEHLDRITRLPLDKAQALMDLIEEKGAKVSVPGLIELPEIKLEGIGAIVFKAAQEMMRDICLYQCRADWETRRERQRQGIEVAKAKGVYKGRKPDTVANAKIVELRAIGYTIAKIASTLNVSESQVKLILKKAKAEQTTEAIGGP
ncbi:recombinase family protein [Massilia sp. CT11-137]|uniref:recombinase family protein n=1 Tax=Massilia sp. CT11-137 TaxID=3393901 RepID=UPI0039A70746